METSTTPLASSPALDDSLPQIRDIPQLHRLRIAPLRNPIPQHSRKAPSPLEPSAGAVRGPKYGKTSRTSGTPSSTDHAALTSLLNNPTHRDKSPPVQAPSEPAWNHELRSKTVLPAFINLRTVERLPPPSFDEDVSRKRIRLEPCNENYGERLQLPIPKLQKEATKPPPFGPLTILNGLNEPPPNAALFPPIEPNGSPTILTRPRRDAPNQSGCDTSDWNQRRRGARIDGIIDPPIYEPSDIGISNDSAGYKPENTPNGNKGHGQKYMPDRLNINETQTPKTKSQPRKKLRKWGERETHDLLLGVVRCGVGNWTAILSQPDLRFYNRTASNLKDRFRVCCPWAYESNQKASAESVRARLADRMNNGKHGKIFLPDPRMTGFNEPKSVPATSSINSLSTAPNVPTPIISSTPSILPPSNTTALPETELTHRKSNARSKNTSSSKRTPSLPIKSKNTLISLGLPDPDTAVKANRRSRRPFTPAEDEALLKGYAVHGFQWTLIRQDKHLNLMHRKATDLRDRFRTKFPSAYREGGSATAKNISPAPVSHPPGNPARPQTDGGNASSSAAEKAHQTRIGAGDNTLHKGTMSTTGIQTTNTTSANIGAAPIDPAMLPPAPPSNATFSFSSLVEDNGACPGSGDNSDLRWSDNTLPPLIWDELG